MYPQNQAQPVSSPQPVQPNNWGAGDNNQSSASWGQPAAPSSNPPQGAAQTQWNTHPQSTAGAGWGGSGKILNLFLSAVCY